jgi:hypothetical protein
MSRRIIGRWIKRRIPHFFQYGCAQNRYVSPLFAVLMLFCAAAHQSVLAQEVGEILLSAQSTQPIEPESSFEIRVSDDSDLNLRLRDVFVERLQNAGFPKDDGSPTLVIWLKSQRITWNSDENGSIGSLRVGSTLGPPSGSLNDPRGSEVDLNVKLWSSTKNSLLRKNKSTRVSRRGFQIVLEVFNNTKDAYIWRGSARATELSGDSFRVGQAMAPRLIEALGQTVEPVIMELY